MHSLIFFSAVGAMGHKAAPAEFAGAVRSLFRLENKCAEVPAAAS